MSSLLTITRERLLEAIRSVQPEPPLKWKTLVVDEPAQRSLLNVLKQNDVLEQNVSAILVTSSPLYAPQPNQEAMYLMMPTTRNVERIVEEFSNGRRQFKKVHLFFLDVLSEELFTRLTESPAFPYLMCVTELFLNFWPLEAQVFSIESPAMFFSIFSPPRDARAPAAKIARDRLLEDMRFAARHIANLCITLNEFPYIRFYNPTHHPPLGPLAPNPALLPPPPPENSAVWRTSLARGEQAREYEAAETEYVSKVLAFMVQAALEEYVKGNPEFPKRVRGRERATLLITDRTMDTVAPFLHEFTYQAMANDLLPIENGVRYLHIHENQAKREERKWVTLNEEDNLWVDVRHLHMQAAIAKLEADFKAFLKEHTSFREDAPTSLDTMKDMIALLPQYQEQSAKFSLHLSMAQLCMSLFEKDELDKLANLEQNFATGLTAEGKSAKSSSLVEEMVPLLDSKNISNSNKLRIISLYMQYREGVPEEDRRRLCQHARLRLNEVDAINALSLMGVRLTRGPGDKDIKKKIKHKPSTDAEYDLSRYRPVLQSVLDDLVADKLDATVFPYVKDAPLPAPSTFGSLRGGGLGSAASSGNSSPTSLQQTTSLRSTRPTWHKAPRVSAAGGAAEVRTRLMVFIAGGMTYSEMRAVYEKSAPLKRDIFIGSTHAYTPDHFMADLKCLSLQGVGSHTAPNGLGEPFGSPQAYFDARYHSPDPPPPPSRAPAASVPASAGKKSGAPPMGDAKHSSSSVSTTGGEEKKKRRFFKF